MRLLPMLLLTACGEYLDFGEESEQVTQQLALNRHELTLMVGDSMKLAATFTPDDGKEHNVFWTSDSTLLAAFASDTIVARAPGQVMVRGIGVSAQQQDSCLLTVIPRWEEVMDPYAYSNDMVVYATVTVDGETNSSNFVLGAFIGDELRGVGRLRQQDGRSYWVVRVYDNDDQVEVTPEDDNGGAGGSGNSQASVVSFRCYERGKGRVVVFPQTIAFDGSAHGTLSKLTQLSVQTTP